MRKLINILVLSSILIILLAFDFKDNPPSGWYQSFLPNIGNTTVSDLLFLDSLTGFMITENATINDTSYFLKTTNRGDNWEIKYRAIDDFSTIKFPNSTTGFTCGSDLYKTTNAGENWFIINAPNQTRIEDMDVFSTDLIWFVDSEGLTGGVFHTTNGGANWDKQTGGGAPEKIYMYNARIGFVSKSGEYIRKTTNSGVNWITVSTEGFTDMHFIDSLTGWCSFDTMKKTTDGGLT